MSSQETRTLATDHSFPAIPAGKVLCYARTKLRVLNHSRSFTVKFWRASHGTKHDEFASVCGRDKGAAERSEMAFQEMLAPTEWMRCRVGGMEQNPLRKVFFRNGKYSLALASDFDIFTPLFRKAATRRLSEKSVDSQR